MKIFAYPGYLVGSEISKLVNRGYQQFLKNSKTEVPATADHLKALQSFAEELKVGLGPAQPLQRISGKPSAIPITTTASKTKTKRRSIVPSAPGKSLAAPPPPKRAARKPDVYQPFLSVPPCPLC